MIKSINQRVKCSIKLRDNFSPCCLKLIYLSLENNLLLKVKHCLLLGLSLSYYSVCFKCCIIRLLKNEVAPSIISSANDRQQIGQYSIIEHSVISAHHHWHRIIQGVERGLILQRIRRPLILVRLLIHPVQWMWLQIDYIGFCLDYHSWHGGCPMRMGWHKGMGLTVFVLWGHIGS